MTNTRQTYHEVEPLGKAETLAKISTNDPAVVSEALVSVGLFESDYDFACEVILERGKDQDPVIRGAALIALAHLARRYRRVPPSAVELVQAALQDPSEYIRGQAESAADDIDQFVATSRRNA